jgi:hypothetical protein
MRRLAVAIAAVLTVALAASIPAGAAPTKPTDRFKAEVDKAAPLAVGGGTTSAVYNTAFTRAQRNHLGDAAKGFVVFDGWVRNRPNPNDTYDPADVPTQGRGCYSAFKASKVKRVQLNSVQVLDADSDTVVSSSAGAVNSGDVAPLVQLCTGPDAFDLTAAPLRYYVEVNATIRWSDDTLSQNVVYATTRDTNTNLMWSFLLGA